MKKRNQLLSLALAAVLAVSLTACGSKSAAQVLAQAQKQEQEVTSMTAAVQTDMEMVIAMDGEEERLVMTSTMDVTMFSDPLKLQMTMAVETDGVSQELSLYAQQSDESYVVYMSEGGSWYSQTVELADLGQYNAAYNMQLYLDGSAQLKEAGSESINGVDTYKYTGEITGEAMEELIEESGVLASLGSLVSAGLGEDKLAELLDGLGGMPITIWIDKTTCYPVRYVVDMSQTMDDLMSNIFQALQETFGDELGDLSVSVPTLTMTMDCSNINDAENFEIPDEALEAYHIG